MIMASVLAVWEGQRREELLESCTIFSVILETQYVIGVPISINVYITTWQWLTG